MDRNLALEVVRVTEMAAIACARLHGPRRAEGGRPGRVDAMRRAFDDVRHRRHRGHRRGRARRGAHALHRREGRPRAARAAAEVDIALDPLEGTNLCADRQARRHRRHRHGQQGLPAQRARHVHGEAGRRPARPGRHRPRRSRPPRTSSAIAERDEARRRGAHRGGDGPAPQRRLDSRGASGGRPRAAHRRRRRGGGRRHLLREERHRRADGHRRRAGGRHHRRGHPLHRRRHAGAPALPQPRGAAPARRRWASPTPTASTAPRTWPGAT